ncbi:autotransporter assembly complex protein TamB [Aliiglaciecola lipolytica]|uniref:autotransporter assembly complex protein TamB n=1 Tax=Aliiglaciecola lipolytica TaxID=477689 RepID=UPI001C093CAC|nr:translocation/assembly module TamB domain-containing protein [Aliiglaciecola lipolytica]MBU2878819.1 translocation/assembly module TamB [Aliiglaciecola lipolytica]
MMWLKRTGKWTAYILIILICLIGFLFTPWGTSSVIAIANSSVDGLNIRHKSGGLLGTLEFQKIKFQSSTIDIDASNLKTNIDWSCSLLMQVCLSELYLGKTTITVGESEPTETQEALQKISLPVAVIAPNIQLNNLSVEIENVAKISWQSLLANLNMHKVLNIESLEIRQPKIVLANKEPPKQAATDQQPTINIGQISNWQYQPVELPPLMIPIDINGKKIVIRNARIMQVDEEIFAFNRLSTGVIIEDSSLTIEQFELEHELINVQVDLALSKDYLLALSSKAQTTDNNQNQLVLQANANGDLKALEFDTQITGDINATAQGSATLDSPKLPINLKINWQPVTLPAEQPIHISSGNLSLVGDMENYQLDLQTSLSATGIPTSQVQVAASGNNQKIQLTKAQINTLGGNIHTSGVVVLTDVARWQGKALVEQIQPGLFWSDLEGSINASLMHSGVYGSDVLQAKIDKLSADGNWLGYPLKAAGNASYDKNSGLDIPSLSLANGENTLTVKGKLDSQNTLAAKLDFIGKELTQLYPDLDGSTGLSANISGTLTEPKVEYELTASQVNYQTISLHSLSSKGSVNWDENKRFDIRTNLEQLVINQEPINTIQFELAGDAKQHKLITKVDSQAFQIDSTIEGHLEETKWVGQWITGNFSSQWGAYSLDQQNTQLLADWQNQHYQIDAHCWNDQQAELCVNQASFKNQIAEFDIHGNQLELLQIISQFVPQLQNISTDTQFFFTAKGKWQADSLPVAKVAGHFSPTSVKIKGLKKPVDMQKLAFDMSVDGQQVISHFDFQTQSSGAIDLDLTITDLEQKRNLQGELKLKDILAKPYQELIPQLTELSGTVNGNLALSGDLKTPLLDGKLQLKNFNFAGEEIPGRVSDWNQDMEFAGQSAKLKGDFMFGNGKGSSAGTLDWTEELIGDFSLKGDTFELEYRDLVRTRFSPNLQVEMTKQAINVSGSTDVFYARIKVKDLPANAQSPSDDTIIVNQPVEEKTVTRDLNMVFNVNIDPKKTDDVKLEAFGLKTDLRGSLELKQSNQRLTGNGSLNLVNGTYKAFGQDLVIQKGNILFSGPLDNPRLDIEAIRDESKTEDDVIAGVRVSGAAEQPSVEVFSTPTMIQSEALSYLLLGKSMSSESQTSNDQVLAAALLSQGLKGSENKVDQLGRKLGIEDLALGANSDDDGTQISLSGNIAPGVQLRYGVNVFDSSTEVALRYQILPKLFLEATSGIEQALDVYYQFSVGGKSISDDE